MPSFGKLLPPFGGTGHCLYKSQVCLSRNKSNAILMISSSMYEIFLGENDILVCSIDKQWKLITKGHGYEMFHANPKHKVLSAYLHESLLTD